MSETLFYIRLMGEKADEAIDCSGFIGVFKSKEEVLAAYKQIGYHLNDLAEVLEVKEGKIVNSTVIFSWD